MQMRMQAEAPPGRPTPDALVRFSALAKVGRSYAMPQRLRSFQTLYAISDAP